jgi:hypothetical protein
MKHALGRREPDAARAAGDHGLAAGEVDLVHLRVLF